MNKTSFFRLEAAIMLLFITLLAHQARAAEETIWVSNSNPTGPGSLASAIQKANAAPEDVLVDIRFHTALDRATIEVGDEPLPEIKRYRISIDASSLTSLTLHGQGNAHILRFVEGNHSGGYPTSISIKGLTLKNGYSEDWGGCLYLGPDGQLEDWDSEPQVTIINAVFEGCRVVSKGEAHGGAIAVSSPRFNKVRISDSVFVQNQARSHEDRAYGGAISLRIGPGLVVVNSRFEDNRALADASGSSWGGAINSDYGRLEILASDFHQNNAVAGAAVHFANGSGLTGSIDSSIFSDNYGQLGFDVYAMSELYAVDLIVKNNMFVNAGNPGRASIYANFVDLELNNNTFHIESETVIDPAILLIAPQYGGWHASIQAANNVFSRLYGNGCEIIPSEDDELDVVLSNNNFVSDFSCSWLATHQVHSDLELKRAPIRGRSIWGVVPASADSPVVSGGSVENPNGELPGCESVDIRGMPRPGTTGSSEARCDAGAFEWQHEPPLYRSCFESGGCAL